MDSADSQIARLLKRSGRRPRPEAPQASRAWDAAFLEWSRVVRRRRRARIAAAGLIAACMLALVSATLVLRTRAVLPAREVARLDAQAGNVAVLRAGSTAAPASGEESVIRAADRVRTGATGLARLTAGAASIRLHHDTSVQIEPHRLILTRGTVYVDAGRDPGGPRWRVETPLGAVDHVGTQFEVRLQGVILRVRVREGSVSVSRREDRWSAAAGEGLTLPANGSPAREAVATWGQEWAWVGTLAPPFVLEGATLAAFLDWISREQGWTWRVEGGLAASSISSTVLHGSIDGLTAEQALAVVMASSDLSYTLEDGVLRIRRADATAG